MSSQYTLKISPEQAKEVPMVDLVFEILKAANDPFYFRDIMQEIAKIKGIPDDEVREVIAQLYTEINIDGRFACVGSNLWGLKRWYPVEKADDAMSNTKRTRIINDEEDDIDEENVFGEDEEEEDISIISADEEEDFDAVDEDDENLYDEEDLEDADEDDAADRSDPDADDDEEDDK